MSDLPSEFRLIRMRLAREPGHPTGSGQQGYDLVAPLGPDGHILPDLWKAHRAACRVRKLNADGSDEIGALARRPGGAWYFDYDAGDDADDEAGFRFQEERFVIGEYVSLREDGVMRTYQITAVEKP